jgi:hypothetical protein
MLQWPMSDEIAELHGPNKHVASVVFIVAARALGDLYESERAALAEAELLIESDQREGRDTRVVEVTRLLMNAFADRFHYNRSEAA